MTPAERRSVRAAALAQLIACWVDGSGQCALRDLAEAADATIEETGAEMRAMRSSGRIGLKYYRPESYDAPSSELDAPDGWEAWQLEDARAVMTYALHAVETVDDATAAALSRGDDATVAPIGGASC